MVWKLCFKVKYTSFPWTLVETIGLAMWFELECIISEQYKITYANKQSYRQCFYVNTEMRSTVQQQGQDLRQDIDCSRCNLTESDDTVLFVLYTVYKQITIESASEDSHISKHVFRV